MGKRVFDVIASAIAIVALSPVLLLTAIAIRLEDGAPSIFVQTRIGRRGGVFKLYKFRSMPVDTANVPSTDTGRLRITKVGAVIRRLNADELPQLFNVLIGDMSLVGPRPALPVQEELVSARSASGALEVRPGLTGLAQVNSYDGMPWSEKAAYDASYANAITCVRDMVIIVRTISYLLRRPPVY